MDAPTLKLWSSNTDPGDFMEDMVTVHFGAGSELVSTRITSDQAGDTQFLRGVATELMQRWKQKFGHTDCPVCGHDPTSSDPHIHLDGRG